MNPNLNPKPEPIFQHQSLKTRPERNPSCKVTVAKKSPRINFVKVSNKDRNKLTPEYAELHHSPLISCQSQISPFFLFSTLLHSTPASPLCLSYRLFYSTRLQVCELMVTCGCSQSSIKCILCICVL